MILRWDTDISVSFSRFQTIGACHDLDGMLGLTRRRVGAIAAVFPLLTGVVVRAFAWLIILGRNGILNNTLVNLGIISEPLELLYTQGAVIIGMVYLFVPLMILSLAGVLENIPQDVLQASSSLGASPVATFWQVLLPLAVPGLIVGAVLVFTGSFTAYATPQLLGGERQTVLATLLQQRAMVSFDWVGASTIATIMTAITISVVLVMSSSRATHQSHGYLMSNRPNFVLIAIAVLVYLFLMGPLVIVVGASLSDTTFLTFPPQGLSLRWFENVFAISAFRRTIVTSLQIAILGTFVALLIGLPAAYALNRYRIELPRWLGTLFVLPILVPEIVFGFALLKSLSVGAGVPVFGALLVGHTLLVLPYVVRVISASLASFDFSIEEAAISLGSAPLKTFFTIVLPNVRAGVIAAFILAFITSLNDVSVSLFLTGPGVSTLPIQILAHVEQFFDPTVASVSVLLMFLTVAVMAVVERTLGLTFLAK